jgi:uncharacterized protein (TIGR00255 family)
MKGRFAVDNMWASLSRVGGQLSVAGALLFWYFDIPKPNFEVSRMVTSMTGYGRGEAGSEGISVSVEVRSVNGRYLEVIPRLPRTLALRENDIKDVVRRSIGRGKITVHVTVDRGTNGTAPLRVDAPTARAYYRLLNDLRKTVRLRQTVRLEHLLQFSEIFEPQELEQTTEQEWEIARTALEKALDQLVQMRRKEGGQLEKDLRPRLELLSGLLNRIEEASRSQVPKERERLRERIAQLVTDQNLDEGRLELEIALLADRLDVTEECVRFRSHVKFFLQAMESEESAGRKLNFLIQEMNREANTIGSKCNDTAVAHFVVQMKEELERIREQLQNVE